MFRRQLQERLGQADFVVEILFRLQDTVLFAEDGSDHIARRRLADRTGDGYDGDGKAAAVEAGQVLIGLERVGGDENRRRQPFIFRTHFRYDCPGSAGSQGLIYEIMAVERRPFEGDEQRTLGDGPRIRADIAERHRGGRLQEPGASGLDYFFASKSSHYLSPLCSAWTALRASSRSSK